MGECSICTDPYNKIRKRVQCLSCEDSACTRCIKTFLMNNTIEPKCMACKSSWNMEFVRQHLSKSFLDSEYKKHQISALLSQAESSLGDLQRFVPLRTRIDELTQNIKSGKERMESIYKDLSKLVGDIVHKKNGFKCYMHLTRKKEDTFDQVIWFTRWNTLSDNERQVFHSMATKANRQLENKRTEGRLTKITLNLHLEEKKRLVHSFETGQDVAAANMHTQEGNERERAVFFMACPRKECRGRVSSVYKCGLCQHWACPECHGDKGLERNNITHECRKEDRETVVMLKKNTKNCPECHEGIFKEYGCDQMWCTQCRTCFSWNTGKKLNGAIHNPHYYEYMFQNTGLGPGAGGADVHAFPGHMDACNGFPEYDRLVRKWSKTNSGITKEDQKLLNNNHRLANHLRYVEIPRLQTSITDHEERNNQKWGIEYLRNNVTREEWGNKLYLAYRKKEREQRKLQILEMFMMVTRNLYHNWYNNDMTSHELMYALKNLIQYANDNISIHNKQYGTKTPFLDPNTPISQHILDIRPRA